jgi:hypothetical protein
MINLEPDMFHSFNDASFTSIDRITDALIAALAETGSLPSRVRARAKFLRAACFDF